MSKDSLARGHDLLVRAWRPKCLTAPKAVSPPKDIFETPGLTLIYSRAVSGMTRTNQRPEGRFFVPLMHDFVWYYHAMHFNHV